MFKPLLFSVAIATITCSSLFAQDFQLSQFNAGSEFPGMAKKQTLDSLPSDFFAQDEVSTGVVQIDEPVSSAGNTLVLVGFATLLGLGGVITGLCVARRKKQSKPAAPVNMFA